MGGKKKDKEAKKARSLEKQQKAKTKSENKSKKLAKKSGDEEEEDVDIDEILANFAKQQEEFEAVTVESCSRPSRRQNAAMVSSPIHGKRELLLFGGETVDDSGSAKFYNELYSYNLDNDVWRRITSPNSPLPRSGHSMCVHPSGIILLFGGEFSSPKQSTFYHYGDTWILDGQSKEWTKVEAKKGPSARSGHRMTYWKNYILLHGGFRDLSASTTYLNDLWAFDVTSYRWHQIELPGNGMYPEARSGHSFMPIADGAVVWGGYSKVKGTGGSKKGQLKGKVHQDTWVLKMKPDLQKVSWERRKKAGFGPSPRVGCSMVHHRGRGILFGGVYDTNETEESLESAFYNNLYAYQLEQNRWFSLQLRAPRKKKTSGNNNTNNKDNESRHAELEATLAEILNGKLHLEEDEEIRLRKELREDEDKDGDSSEEGGKKKTEYPIVNHLPHARFNTATTVVDDILFLYGGTWENGDVECNIDSLYSIDLGRLDGLKVYWEDLSELDKTLEDSDEEDMDGEEDDEGDMDDEEGEEEDGENQEEEDQAVAQEEEETVDDTSDKGTPDPRPWLPHPKPFESLRDFYARTGDQFMEWALSSNRDARGKDLKRVAFDLSEDRWWERREEVRLTEEQYEEMGGVGDVIERDASSRKGRR